MLYLCKHLGHQNLYNIDVCPAVGYSLCFIPFLLSGIYISLYILALQDYPKLHRCTELLSMNEELKQARKAFDVSEENLANATTD